MDMPNGLELRINNKTNLEISGIKLTYHNIKEDIVIPPIKSNKTYKLSIHPSEEFGENSLKAYYFDKNDIKQREWIIGYFEKGYGVKAIVDIISVDENGIIEFDVENKY